MSTPTPVPASAADTRRYLIERVDDAAVVQLYADGFADLALREQVLIYHLYQAALAGRDIYYDQRYAHNLEMRDVLEEILTHASGIDAETLAEIERYTKLFWINTGPYNNLTARKFVLKCTPSAFAAAAAQAARNGARVPADLERMTPYFFDPDFEPIVTSKTPGNGKDILQASANNLYDGVTMADLEGFTERYPLNSRLVKRDGRLIEEVYRVGGMYDRQIREIVTHLRAAIPFATAPMANALRALIAFYETGETADRIAYDIAWVQDRDSPVDTINGFVEVYMDARGMKGAWEALVYYVNPHKIGCRGPRNTGSRACAASRPTPSTSSSRLAIRAR
jgi:dipeptidyl-peptidase III